MNNYVVLSLIWVWVGGPIPVGRKSENFSAKILPHKAENILKLKKYSPLVINVTPPAIFSCTALDCNYCGFIDIHGYLCASSQIHLCSNDLWITNQNLHILDAILFRYSNGTWIPDCDLSIFRHFGCHSKSEPLAKRTEFYHWKTGLVQYWDQHCISLIWNIFGWQTSWYKDM